MPDEITLTGPNGAKPTFARLVLDGATVTTETWTGNGKRRTTGKEFGSPAQARQAYRKASYDRMAKGFVYLRDVAEAQAGDLVMQCVPPQSRQHYAFDLSPDGATLVTGTPDDRDGTGKLHLIDVATGRLTLVHTVAKDPINELGRWIHSVQFGGTGTTLVSTVDGDTHLLDLDTGESRVIASYPLFGQRFNAARMHPCFDAARRRLLVYDDKTTVRVIDGGESVFELAVAEPPWPSAGALAPSGSLLALGFSDGTVGVWDVGSGLPLDGEPFRLQADVRRVGFDPAGHRLLAAVHDRFPYAWRLADRESVDPEPDDDTSAVGAWSYSPDGTLLTVCGSMAFFYDPGTLRRLPIEPVPASADRRAVFSADGRLMAVGGQRLSVYRLPTGQ